MSIATMEEEIVDVNVRLSQGVRQQFSRTSLGIALNSRGLGSYFKTGTITCWLDMADDWYQ